MAFVIGLLTLVMVLDCVVLVFLVLLQLPKKEAGAGMAFGGGAADALFGAGKGTILTNITKYTAIVFFALAIALSVLQSHFHNRNTSAFQQQFYNPSATPSSPSSSATTPAPKSSAPAAPATSTNNLLTPMLAPTNAVAPAVPAKTPVSTNAPGK